MAAADLIYVIGSKRAFPVTAYISLTLSQQGVRNVLVDNVGSTAFDQVGCVGPGDAVLAVSFSPYNSITPELVAAASERSAKIVVDHRLDLQPAGQAQRRLDRGDRIGFCRLPLARGDARRRHGAGPGHRRAAVGGRVVSLRSWRRKLELRSFSESPEDRMNIHKNARLTPYGREVLVRQIVSGQTVKAAALAASVCPRTARKWLARFLAEGVEGLQDRSSRPHRLFRPTPPEIVERVEALRRQRWTGKQIAAELDISPATVSRILKRLGLNRIVALEPAVPIRRYERDHPGELIHIDIKKLGRFERVGHRITGDRQKGTSRGAGLGVRPRLLSTMPLASPSRRSSPTRRRKAPSPSSRPPSPTTPSLGVTVDRVMTDNGSCYRSFDFRDACRRLGLTPHQDQALHPEDQRQGRALHPDRAPRMGLRPRLSELGSPRRRTADLAPSIQLASSPRQPKIKTANQQTRPEPGQPVEAPQLAARSRLRPRRRFLRRPVSSRRRPSARYPPRRREPR